MMRSVGVWGHFIWVLVPSILLAASATSKWRSVDAEQWSKKYDGHFRKYSKHYFGPNIDWRWFKAQAITESALQVMARSHVGAQGIMQIMPQTYKEIQQMNPHFRSVDEPRWNIAAGIYYDRAMYRKWHKKLPRKERLSFAFASYNAGFGRVNSAYRRAGKKKVKRWPEVAPYTPKETQDYVARIQALMKGRRQHVL